MICAVLFCAKRHCLTISDMREKLFLPVTTLVAEIKKEMTGRDDWGGLTLVGAPRRAGVDVV
jgi:hypothetical protein